MPNPAPLSPLRRHLCSYDHAARVAGAMADAGLDVAIESTVNPLQPWRIVETPSEAAEPRILACA
ncbi:hypothetical protein [uncultured Sphingomonas sp.]|uniref:hypothetical protein n=1 Tax=uncultured Sphingomonas sp. TaxID=158754 RepID=UPI0035CA15AF